MRVGILEKLPILHTKLAIFGLLVHMLHMQISRVTSLPVGKSMVARIGSKLSNISSQIT